MKATFICGVRGLRSGMSLVVASIGLAACVDLELPPTDEQADSSDTDACTDDCPSIEHGFSGEVILFANARLSDPSSSFQSHLPLDEEGTFIGNSLYLYDPTRVCDDGGNACRVVELGWMRLDERLGEISLDDGSLRKFVVRDIAWHPEHGLWAATFDTFNDEWSISKLEVPDWTLTSNSIGVDRWVVPPGPAESPSTDPCYWFEAVSGLGFAGDELLLGVRGAGSKGLWTDGSLLRIDMSVFDQGHCVHPSDVSQDPLYYACDVVCEPWCSFGSKVGVAGDIVAEREGAGASAWLRSEDETIMPLARNELASCQPPEPGQVSSGEPDNVYDDEVVRGDEIDGLARVGDKLYGLSVLGKVYEIDEVQRTIEQIDDLSNLFPEQGLRLRGATEVVLPSE